MNKKHSHLQKVAHELGLADVSVHHDANIFSKLEIEEIRHIAKARAIAEIKRSKFRQRYVLSAAAMFVICIGIYMIMLVGQREQSSSRSQMAFSHESLPEAKLAKGEFRQIHGTLLMGGLENARVIVHDGNPVAVKIISGQVMFGRKHGGIGFSVVTGQATYTPTGTLFVVQVSDEDNVFLQEGRLEIRGKSQANQVFVLESNGQRFATVDTQSGVVLAENVPNNSHWQKTIYLIQEVHKRDNISKDFFADMIMQNKRNSIKQYSGKQASLSRTKSVSSKSTFTEQKSGDCVYFFRNSERYQGEVSDVTNSGIRISRGGVLEDKLYSPEELTPCR